jgi:hypothetical protein
MDFDAFKMAFHYWLYKKKVKNVTQLKEIKRLDKEIVHFRIVIKPLRDIVP